MSRLLDYYAYRVVCPFLALLAASLLALFLVLWAVSAVEAQMGRPTVFDLEIEALGDAPFWVLTVAGMLVVNGVSLTQWALMRADVSRRRTGQGYEVNIPFPIGKVTGIAISYIGITVFLFYAVRCAGT